jgi:hypothetical protein
MHSHNGENGFGGSGTNFLSPMSSRKPPPHQSPSPTINTRRSTSSLRGTPSPDDGEGSINGRHSLAHELAVALMPEPSSGSKLLAEEFGIEYDEGAEGIDEDSHERIQIVIDDGSSSFGEEFQSNNSHSQAHSPYFGSSATSEDADHDPTFASPRLTSKKLETNDIATLAQDLESTDKFLSHLRRLDTDTGPSHSLPALERIASDIIRRINDTSRDREGQVRQLLECEREFKKIAVEVGGSDVLGTLDEFPEEIELVELQLEAAQPGIRPLDVVQEETPGLLLHDWETDPDIHRLGDEVDSAFPSPVKDSFPPPPPLTGPLTPAKTIPQLADLRSFTTSLVASLSTISEQAQVNGAATSEAGRKIRALKNKMGGWRTDWDSAERSKLKIERWEAGIVESDVPNGIHISPTRSTRRIDGRKFVEEHMRAFERALADAAVKTNAIMAAC